MENVLLTLVVVLLILVLIMLAGMAVLGWRMWQGKISGGAPTSLPPIPNDDDRYPPEIRQRMEEARRMRASALVEATCHLHPQEASEGACAVCDQYFCRSCLKPHRNLTFCREHLNVYLSTHWTEVHTVPSTPLDPEAGVVLVEWKKKVWQEQALPLYLETHYKIHVDGDRIESWMVLFARETDAITVRKLLVPEA